VSINVDRLFRFEGEENMKRCISNFRKGCLILMGVLLAFSLAVRPARAAGRDISGQAVTGLAVNVDQDYFNGSSIKVTVTFGEHDGLDIHQDDVIQVTWPSSGEFYLEGVYLANYQLYTTTPPSTMVGLATVTAGGATIVFNAAAENFQNLQGSLTFWATGRTGSGSQEEGDVTITAGDQSKTVHILRYGSSSGTPPFSSKTNSGFPQKDGETDFTTAIWDLSINRAVPDGAGGSAPQALDGTVTIVDLMPKGVTFDAFSWCYMASATRSEAATIYGAGGDETVRRYLAQRLNATIEYRENDPEYPDYNVLKITFPGEKMQILDDPTQPESVDNPYRPSGLVLEYTTKIDVAALVQPGAAETPVRNAVTVKYRLITDPEDEYRDEEHSSTVHILRSSADIDGVPKGVIRLSKVVDGTTVPIAGVTFRAYQLTGENGTRKTGWYYNSADQRYYDYVEFTTGADGVAESPILDDGYYEVAEAAAPDWVVKTTQAIKVTLSGNTGYEGLVENAVREVPYTVTKQWVNADGSADRGPHPTIWLILVRSVEGGQPETVEDSLVKLPDGVTEIVYESLPQYDNYGRLYTYSVKEVDEDGKDYVPEGYSKAESGLTVVNTKNPPEEPHNPEVPNTGDPLELYALLMLASGAGALIVRKRRG
jgi:hypothetical protein